MREIRFRARKRKDWPGIQTWFYWSIGQTPNYEALDMNTACEFTGLHDKNGVEIWEWDVVQFENDVRNHPADKMPMERGYIEVKLGSTWVNTPGDVLSLIQFDVTQEVEVLGNLLEHPELLKGEKS